MRIAIVVVLALLAWVLVSFGITTLAVALDWPRPMMFLVGFVVGSALFLLSDGPVRAWLGGQKGGAAK